VKAGLLTRLCIGDLQVAAEARCCSRSYIECREVERIRRCGSLLFMRGNPFGDCLRERGAFFCYVL
jgi:hypothetical protein